MRFLAWVYLMLFPLLNASCAELPQPIANSKLHDLRCTNDHPETCKGNTFCKLPIGECTMNTIRSGVCTEKAEICTHVYDPVCGCDGKTYSNACKAESAAVSVSKHGPCN